MIIVSDKAKERILELKREEGVPTMKISEFPSKVAAVLD